MTLNNFINELKHKSLEIVISLIPAGAEIGDKREIAWEGTVGTYLTSVFSQTNGQKVVFAVLPLIDGSLEILI